MSRGITVRLEEAISAIGLSTQLRVGRAIQLGVRADERAAYWRARGVDVGWIGDHLVVVFSEEVYQEHHLLLNEVTDCMGDWYHSVTTFFPGYPGMAFVVLGRDPKKDDQGVFLLDK